MDDKPDLSDYDRALARSVGAYRAALIEAGIPPALADALTFDWYRLRFNQPPTWPPYGHSADVQDVGKSNA